MGKLGKCGLFIVLVMALSFVSASSYDVQFNQIDSSLVVKEVIKLDNVSSFDVILPEDYEDLYVEGKFNQDGDKLSFYDSSAKVIYSTKEGISNSREGFFFIKKVEYVSSFDAVSVRLNLEKGVVIDKAESYPMDYKIETDGEKISLVWRYGDVKKGAKLPMFVTLEDLTSDSSGGWIILLIVLVVLMIGGYPVYKFVKKKSRSKYDALLDGEKKIIDILKKADKNELWQKQLQTSTGFSKAKLSRIVRDLEARGLIRKVPYGNTNKVSLE